MKKIIFLAVLFLTGCSLWQMVEGPVVPLEGTQENGVLLVTQKPAENCVFKGALLNDIDPTENGMVQSFLELNTQMRQSLSSGALRMGGNTVWLKQTDWDNPSVSTDYLNPSTVNNVFSTALVYSCPEN